MRGRRFLIAAVAGGLLLAGCGRGSTPPAAPPTPEEWAEGELARLDGQTLLNVCQGVHYMYDEAQYRFYRSWDPDDGDVGEAWLALVSLIAERRCW